MGPVVPASHGTLAGYSSQIPLTLQHPGGRGATVSHFFPSSLSLPTLGRWMLLEASQD